MRRHAILAALLVSVMLAGCGGNDDTTTATTTTKAKAAAAPTDTIRIANFLYDPDPSTVKAGTKITVTNADSAPHTVTEKGASPSFDSGTIRGKARGSITFSKPGTFTYYCQFHATMNGTVTVVR
jgi:plastocyanin